MPGMNVKFSSSEYNNLFCESCYGTKKELREAKAQRVPCLSVLLIFGYYNLKTPPLVILPFSHIASLKTSH